MRIAGIAVGRLLIQILVSLEALLATEQHEGNEFRWQNLNSLPESHFTDGVNALKPEGGFEPWSNSGSFEIMVSETQLFFCSCEGSCTEFLPVAVISCSEVCALEANEGKELKGKIYRDICHI